MVRAPADSVTDSTSGVPDLRLRVPRIMPFGPFREEPFSAALPTPRQGRTAAFSPHASPEPMLTFPGPFRRLIGAFHNRQIPALAGERLR
jgi:hypothetical protein